MSWGCSATTIHISTYVLPKFAKCVTIAILLLEKSVVYYTNDGEKEAIKYSIEDSYGFSNVIGIADGTHVNLATKPSY